jgi:hypothetical protein
VGCPIRRSGDQRALASPPGFSQRATSFLASWRQGIHQMPLPQRLIAQTRRSQGQNQGSEVRTSGIRYQDLIHHRDPMPSIAPAQSNAFSHEDTLRKAVSRQHTSPQPLLSITPSSHCQRSIASTAAPANFFLLPIPRRSHERSSDAAPAVCAANRESRAPPVKRLCLHRAALGATRVAPGAARHKTMPRIVLVGGGGERNRTVDLLLAKQALSQLSYTP